MWSSTTRSLPGLERPRGVGRLDHRHLARRPAEYVLHLIARPSPRSRGPGRHDRARATRAPGSSATLAWCSTCGLSGAELDGAHVARRRCVGTGMTKLRNTSRLPGLQRERIRRSSARGPACRAASRPANVGGGAPSGHRLPARPDRDPLLDERDLIVAEPALVERTRRVRARAATAASRGVCVGRGDLARVSDARARSRAALNGAPATHNGPRIPAAGARALRAAAPSIGRWHVTQFSNRIGAMSLLKVTTRGTAPASL